jgi:hypothetical protein
MVDRETFPPVKLVEMTIHMPAGVPRPHDLSVGTPNPSRWNQRKPYVKQMKCVSTS